MKKIFEFLNGLNYKQKYFNLKNIIEDEIRHLEKERTTLEKYRCYSDLRDSELVLNILYKIINKEKAKNQK